MKNCSVPGCNRKRLAKGLCNMHYHRSKTGKPMSDKPRIPSGSAVNFIKKTAKSKDHDCIIWPFSKRPDGYGRVQMHGTTVANKAMCIEAHGPPPTDMHQAAHSCRNTACVNPNHLRWATPAENSADRAIHGTDIRGVKNPNAKLTESDVREILKAKGLHREIAARYNVGAGVVDGIKAGKSWTHVTQAE